MDLYKIFMCALPVVCMVLLIPFIKNDNLLLLIYAIFIFAFFNVSYKRGEWKRFILGMFIMFCAELIFVSTGVESFERNSLLGIMPVWLPVLWGFTFVMIGRSLKYID